MIKNYTIASLKALSYLPKLDTAQVTLNSRQWPGKRQTVKLLNEMSPYHNTDIIIHWDFIYIISRYLFFNKPTKEAILKEMVDILNYSAIDSRIKGVVMHTDFPLRKECYVKGVNTQKISDTYTGSLWDTVAVIFYSADINTLLERSILEFYKDLKAYPLSEGHCKIYLENTTKVPQGDVLQGSPQHLLYVFSLHQEIKDVFGLAYDTEHAYVVEGEIWDIQDIYNISQHVDLVVHLNTIPDKVKPMSLKDLHSDTTVFECSVNPTQFYMDYAQSLSVGGIPWVREVKEDTMFREMKQLEEYGNNRNCK